jgi:hypothetical protein
MEKYWVTWFLHYENLYDNWLGSAWHVEVMFMPYIYTLYVRTFLKLFRVSRMSSSNEGKNSLAGGSHKLLPEGISNHHTILTHHTQVNIYD